MRATAKEVFMIVMFVPAAAIVLGLACSVIFNDGGVQ
jgi:hypothetical protein